MAAGHGLAGLRIPERPDFVHRETRIAESPDDLLPYLETVRPDGRSDDGPKVLRPGSIPGTHLRNHFCDNALNGAAPAGMNRRDDMPDRIMEQDGHAVCGPHADRQSGDIRDQGIESLQIVAAHFSGDDGDVRSMDLMRRQDGIREHAVAARREGLDARSEVVCQEVRHRMVRAMRAQASASARAWW